MSYSSGNAQTRLVPRARNLIERVKWITAVIVGDFSNFRDFTSVLELLGFQWVVVRPIGLESSEVV